MFDMDIGMIGLSYKSACFKTRENFTLVFDAIRRDYTGVLVNTCNRSEFYFSYENVEQALKSIFSCISRHIENIEHSPLYHALGLNCFQHLGRVTSGIDSIIFGESDIQRQVKISYQKALKGKKLPKELHFLFQKGLKIGKNTRQLFFKSNKKLILPSIIYSILEKTLENTQNVKALLIGNSSINRKIVPFFQQRGLEITLMTTRVDKEKNKYRFKMTNQDILNNWHDFDVIIAATNRKVSLPFLEGKNFKQKIIIDLGMPSNFDRKVFNDKFIKFLDVDEVLQNVHSTIDPKVSTLSSYFVQKSVEKQFLIFQHKPLCQMESPDMVLV